MKTNITFICLLNHFSKNIGKLLCEKLDMYFVDVEDMINFELGDTNHILTVLGNKEGKKYMKDTESKIIKRIASFENALICVKCTTLFGNRNFDKLKKNSYIVYLQISPKYLPKIAEESKDIIDEKMLTVAFTEKDKMFVDSSDMVVNCSTMKEKKVVKKVMSTINKFFKKSKKEEK